MGAGELDLTVGSPSPTGRGNHQCLEQYMRRTLRLTFVAKVDLQEVGTNAGPIFQDIQGLAEALLISSGSKRQH